MAKVKPVMAMIAKSRDPNDRLIYAASAWLTDRGGKAIVGGPCCIIQMPGSTEHNFYVAVKVLGRKPSPEAMKERVRKILKRK